MKLLELKGVKPLKNKKRSVNKGPINKVSIRRMIRTSKVPTPRLGTATRKDKDKAKVDATLENVPSSVEFQQKILKIENKLDAMMSKLGVVMVTMQKKNLAKNLFYAYVKTWHSSSFSTMSRVNLVDLPKFHVFPPINRSYDFSSATKDVPAKSVNSPDSVREDGDPPREKESSKIIRDCLFNLNIPTDVNAMPTAAQEDEVLVEDVDENEEDIFDVEITPLRKLLRKIRLHQRVWMQPPKDLSLSHYGVTDESCAHNR